MEKMSNKERLKQALPLILAFVLPVIVMVIIFIERGIFPFGDKSFLRTDLYHQYAPFFNEMADKLGSGESMFYSWDIGGGTNFVSLYSYYLASPVNWLLILVPHNYVIEFITYSIVLKMGLCGLTFGIYLKHHNNQNNFAIPIFSLFYALSGYLAAYSWNIMWMDCIWLFPLIMLGLERLVKKNKPFLYCITLALSILSNYYISIMICIFMVLYFMALIISNPTHERITKTDVSGEKVTKLRYTNYFKKLGLFILYSGLAGALAAVTLLPEIYALSLTASSDTTFPQSATIYFSIFEMLARHMMPVNVHLKLDHWPNIYCGVAVFMFIPLYIMNKRINYKEKFINFILVLFMLLSFSLNILNYIWHGFHYPNSLPCRQSFIYIFLILMMCYQGFLGLKERSTKQIVGAASIGIGFCVLAEFLIDSEDFGWYVFYLTILFIAIYALLAYMYRKRKIFIPLLTMITITIATLEGAANMTVTSVTTVTRSKYMSYDQGTSELVSASKAADGGQFYRYEKSPLQTKNDGAWLDYPSISTFSSMSYQSMSTFYRSLGMEAATNAYSSTGMTPVMQALLGVKYMLTMEDDFVTGSTYTKAGESNGVYMYEDDNALPLAYMLPGDIEDRWAVTTYPIDNQINLIDLATSNQLSDNLYDLIPMSPSGSSTSAIVTKSGYYYCYVVSSTVTEVDASHGNFTKNFANLNRHYVLDLGWCEEGETINLTTTDSVASLSVMTYRLNEEVCAQAMDILKQQAMTIDTMSDTYIKGTITAATDGLCFTSIANDPGWSVYVDGVLTQYHGFDDAQAYICFDLAEGTHTVEMRYEPQGIRYGAILSGLSLILLALLFLLRKIVKPGDVEGIDIDPKYSIFSDSYDPGADEQDDGLVLSDSNQTSDNQSTTSNHRISRDLDFIDPDEESLPKQSVSDDDAKADNTEESDPTFEDVEFDVPDTDEELKSPDQPLDSADEADIPNGDVSEEPVEASAISEEPADVSTESDILPENNNSDLSKDKSSHETGQSSSSSGVSTQDI